MEESEYPLDDVKMILEWVLVFALWHKDVRSYTWYQSCVNAALQHPVDRYEHYFWHSFRSFYLQGLAGDGSLSLEEWREYLTWKIDSKSHWHGGKIAA